MSWNTKPQRNNVVCSCTRPNVKIQRQQTQFPTTCSVQFIYHCTSRGYRSRRNLVGCITLRQWTSEPMRSASTLQPDPAVEPFCVIFVCVFDHPCYIKVVFDWAEYFEEFAPESQSAWKPPTASCAAPTWGFLDPILLASWSPPHRRCAWMSPDYVAWLSSLCDMIARLCGMIS